MASTRAHDTYVMTEPHPQDGTHGKVFGVLTWNGRSEGTQERLIHSPLKRVWRAHGAEPAGAGESAAIAALRKELAAQREPAVAAETPEA